MLKTNSLLGNGGKAKNGKSRILKTNTLPGTLINLLTKAFQKCILR